MRTFLLVILFYIPQLFADSGYQLRVHECHNEQGFERRVEVRYDKPGSPVPCRVVFFRGDVKNSKEEHVLFSAQHEVGRCEAAEKEYLAKMETWKVACRQIEELGPQIVEAVVQAAAAAPSQAPAPEDAKKKPAPAGVTKRGWAGFYAGVILGYEFGHSSDKTGDFGYNADDEKWDYNQSGLNFGVAFGHNYLWRRLVLGPEIELGYLSMKGSGAQPDSPGSDTFGKSSSDFYTTLRGRVGIDFDRYLVFATAGAIAINHQAQIVDECGIAPCGGSTINARKENFNLGYTAGAGVEHLFKMYEKDWSVKIEYLYFNLGSQSFSGSTNLGVSYDWTGQASGHIVRGGLDFYF